MSVWFFSTVVRFIKLLRTGSWYYFFVDVVNSVPHLEKTVKKCVTLTCILSWKLRYRKPERAWPALSKKTSGFSFLWNIINIHCFSITYFSTNTDFKKDQIMKFLVPFREKAELLILIPPQSGWTSLHLSPSFLQDPRIPPLLSSSSSLHSQAALKIQGLNPHPVLKSQLILVV